MPGGAQRARSGGPGIGGPGCSVQRGHPKGLSPVLDFFGHEMIGFYIGLFYVFFFNGSTIARDGFWKTFRLK